MGKLTGEDINDAVESISDKEWAKFASHRYVAVACDKPRLLNGTGSRDAIRTLKLLELFHPNVPAIVVLVAKNQ